MVDKTKIQKALDAGYTPEQINAYIGGDKSAGKKPATAQPKGGNFFSELAKYTVEPVQNFGRTVAGGVGLAGSTIAGGVASAYEKVTGKEMKSLGGGSVKQNALNQANWIKSNVMTPRAQQAFDPNNPENRGVIPQAAAVEGVKQGVGMASYMIPGGGGGATSVVGRVGTAALRGTASGVTREAYNEEATPGSIAMSGVGGGVTGGVLQGGSEGLKALGNWLKKSGAPAMVSGHVSAPASKMREKEALMSVMNEMDPERGSTPIVTQLMDRGELQSSPKALIKHTVAKLDRYGKEIGDIVKKNEDVLIPLDGPDGVLTQIDDITGKYSDVWSPEIKVEAERYKKAILDEATKDMTSRMTKVPAGGPISPEASAILTAELQKKQPVISAKALWEMRKEGDDILHKFYSSGAGLESVTPEISFRVRMAGEMRKSLAKNIPDIEPLNNEFSFYKTVQSYTLPTLSKQMNEKIMGGMMMLGLGGAGYAIGSLPGLGAGILASKAIRSPTTAFAVANTTRGAGKAVQGAGGAAGSDATSYAARALTNFLTGSKKKNK